MSRVQKAYYQPAKAHHHLRRLEQPAVLYWFLSTASNAQTEKMTPHRKSQMKMQSKKASIHISPKVTTGFGQKIVSHRCSATSHKKQ
nr:hypothetical protein Iba_chr11fCG13130 [Ipomoea batatas]